MIPANVLKGLSAAEVHHLLDLRKNQLRLKELLEDRDHHIAQAEKIQRRIDAVLGSWVDPTVQRVRPGRRGRGQRLGPTVKEMAVEVLKARKKPMAAAAIKDAILKKYPHRDSDTFYNQVFIAVSRNPEFKKLKDKTYALVEGG